MGACVIGYYMSKVLPQTSWKTVVPLLSLKGGCYPLCVVLEESRRFSWMINWLNERGPLGQVFANLVVALFVLPPLGPIVCSFLENCDSTRASARSLVYHLVVSEYDRYRTVALIHKPLLTNGAIIMMGGGVEVIFIQEKIRLIPPEIITTPREPGCYFS